MNPASRFTLSFILLLASLVSASRAAEETAFSWPLGPLGGKFRIWTDASYVRVSEVTPGAPAANAGLRVNDFIIGAFGQRFDPITADTFRGVVRQLGAAIDHAELNNIPLPLTVLRPGTGALTLNVTLPATGALDPAYPLTSSRYDTLYETACARLHQRLMAAGPTNSEGYLGYPTGFGGLALLGHPHWNSTTGAKPYRLSINKVRDWAVTTINAAIYAPVEDRFYDGTPNPNYANSGLESWFLSQAVMFMSEYLTKTGETATYQSVVQRGAELMANRIQNWNQPSSGGSADLSYAATAGAVSHGGVVGDYAHGGAVGINIVGVHVLNALALAKRAGADMTQRPKDGHYWGYSLNPGDPIPAQIANTLPASIILPNGAQDTNPANPSLDNISAAPLTKVNNPFYYDLNLTQKFWLSWDFLANSTHPTEGYVSYGKYVASPYDAGARTLGAFSGIMIYHGDTALAPAAQLIADRQHSYILAAHDIHLNAHAYNMGSNMFNALSLPYLSDVEQRYLLDNWKFFYNLSQQPDGSLSYFRGRSIGDPGDAYFNVDSAMLVNIALPRSIARGGLPHVPGFSTNRIFARFRQPLLEWPTLAARRIKLPANTSTTSFDLDLIDSSGIVITPTSTTWTVISGPITGGILASPSSLDTTATFPQPGTYRLRMEATATGLSTSEVIDVEVPSATTSTPPVAAIFSHPADVTTTIGQSVTFSLGVVGPTPRLFQWRRNGSNYGSATDAPSLTIPNAPAGLAGAWDCVYTSSSGTLTSNAATLTFSDAGSLTTGGLWQEIYTGIAGSSIADLTNNAAYPATASISGPIAQPSTGEQGADYGQRWTGWIIPSVTDQYRFLATGDDAFELSLSPDARESNRQVIITSSLKADMVWSTAATSSYIPLIAGQRYFVQMLHKEGWGLDHAAFTWQRLGDPIPPNGSAGLIPSGNLQYITGGTLPEAPASYTWINSAGGSWPTASNWLGNWVASGTDEIAFFNNLNLTANAIVTLDGATSIGAMHFDDTTPSHDWVLNTGSGGPLTLDVSTGTPAISVNDTDVTIEAVLSGTKGLDISGNGSLTLSGASTFTGATTVNSGTLVIANSNLLNVGTSITVAPGASLQLHAGANAAYPSCDIFVNGAGTAATTGLSLNAGVTHSVQGSLRLQTAPTTIRTVGAGTAVFTGFDINSEMIVTTAAASGSVIDSRINFSGGYGLRFDTAAGSNTATGDLTVAGDLTNVNVTNFGYYLRGTGSVLLTGPSPNFTNNTSNHLNLNEGTLIFGGSTPFASGNYGGRIAMSGNATLKFQRSGIYQVFSGLISGAGSLVKSNSSTLALSAANTYTGTTTVSGGTLLANNSTGSATSTGAVSVASTATLGGSGSISGPIALSGTLSPGPYHGATGTLTTAAITTGTTPAIAWQVTDWTGSAGTGYDQISATSLDLTSATTITVTLGRTAFTNLTPGAKSFTLVSTSAGITGFASNKFSINSSALADLGGTWAISQSGNNLLLNYTPPSSDIDSDGIPNALDPDMDGDGIANAIDTDTDGDGVPNTADVNDDNDDTLDTADTSPSGPGTTTDHDGDTIANSAEGNGTTDTDGDGTPDTIDSDSDNDGLSDATEAGSDSSPRDSDGDLIADFRDLDSDNDGINDVREANGSDANGDAQSDLANANLTPPDTDGDSIPDYRDLDSDGDTLGDLFENAAHNVADANSDGIADGTDLDADGIADSADDNDAAFGETNDPNPRDTDGTGGPNYRDLDSDNDSISDLAEAGRSAFDTNADGKLTSADSGSNGTDTDGDGVANGVDATPGGFGGVPSDTPGTFADWQLDHRPANAGTTPASNLDGDIYPDLIEFALGLSPTSGSPRSPQHPAAPAVPTLTDTGSEVDLQFIRPTGLTGLTYTIETTGNLATGSWTTASASPTITDNGDGTETVTFDALDTLSGLNGNNGVARLVITLASPSTTAKTQAIGWCRTTLVGKMQTYALNLLNPVLASAEIASATGSTLTLTAALPAGTLDSTRPTFAEIIDGTNAHVGHRFDVNIAASSGTTLALTLASTNNTTNTLPSGLAGKHLVLRQHQRLGDVLPISKFQSGSLSVGSSDQVLVRSGNGFDTYYYLTDGGSNAYWAKVGDNTFANRNTTILPPAAGVFAKHFVQGNSSVVRLLGDVRTHPARIILRQGDNLVATGYPLPLSPQQLGMNRVNGFTGTLSPATADLIMAWRGDNTPNTPGYTSYYLAHDGGQAANEQWVQQGDNTFANHNNSPLLGACRAVFVRKRAPGTHTLLIPVPFTP